ncbi:hypothetical protein SAMN04487934_11733 [Eubacterium ruminantium]|nr:hypothetical protein SAMN04487934_11733 [Eubacterium ruminantium]
MFLSKLLLKEYGSFFNKQIELKDGINLVYDSSREKRRSFKDFIVSMLFGSIAGGGLSIGEDTYAKRKPSGSDYRGTAYVKTEENTYLVDRTFLSGAKKTSVLNLNSGKQDESKGMTPLPMDAVDVDRSIYMTSYAIDDGLKSDERCITEDEIEDVTKRFLKNTVETGSADINFEASIEYLRNIRKSKSTQPMVRRLNALTKQIDAYETVDKEIDGIEDRIKRLDEDFAIEAAKRKRVARKMIQNEDGTVKYEVDEELNKKMDILAETGQDMMKKPENQEKKFTDKLPVIFGAGLLVIFIISLIVFILPFESAVRKLFIIFTTVFVIFTIIDGLRVNGFFDSGEVTPSEEDFKQVLKEIESEKEEKEAVEFDMTFAKEYAENKEALRIEEKELLEKRTERNRLQAEFNSIFKKKSELEAESYAVAAAMNQLIKEREKIMTENLPKILSHISDHIGILSGGRYDSIILDRDFNVSVSKSGVIKDMRELPGSDKRLVYLAVRLGVSQAFSDANLPLILLDVLDDLDSDTIRAVVRVFRNMNSSQQVLITKDAQLGNKLANSGAVFNFVEI